MMRDAATDPQPGDFCASVPTSAGPLAASDAAVLEGLPWRSPNSSKTTTTLTIDHAGEQHHVLCR